jgi:hypothetical protein
MPGREEEDIDDDFFSNIRTKRKTIKEDILDEAFKKAEISKGLRSKEGKKITKKPFLKLGIILIFIAVLSLAVINYLPWMYIKYDVGDETLHESFGIDFKNSEGHYNETIDYIFESPCTNCSNNSKNYLGITKNDFTNIPRLITYAFVSLAILGIIFTIFEVIERKRNLSMELVSLVHSTFAIAAYVVCVFVIFISIKFLGAHFLLFYNRPFIEASGISNIIIIFPVIIILIIISFAIIIIATTVMQINFHEFEKKLLSEKTRSALSTFKFGKEI